MDINKVIKKGYEDGTPISEIAHQVNLHRSNVLQRARMLDLVHPNRNSPRGKIGVDSSLQEAKMPKLKNEEVRGIIDAEAKAEDAKAKSTLAQRKYKLLLDDHRRLQREYDALTGHMGRGVKPVDIKPRHKPSKNEAVPILVLSDWHVEEEVRPQTIGGKNKFNLDIAKSRAARCFQTAAKLVREKEDDVEINDIAIFALGDFITGNIHDENVENALLLPLDALMYAQELLEGGINYLLENTNKSITIYCKVGNHSRITRKVHASTEWENSLEFAMYWSMRRTYENNPRVRFHIEPSYLSVIKILGHSIRFHHGHAVSYGGGVGGLHIPLRKAINGWNQNERAVLDIMGHYHCFTQFTTMQYVVNGSLIGYNAYAERIKAAAEPPIQGFGLIHKKYGFTHVTPIFLE